MPNASSNTILVGSSSAGGRIKNSVEFTEAYKDRVMGLFTDRPGGDVRTPDVKPIRCILLQNVFGGCDGLAVEIGREKLSKNSAFWLEVVGVNNKQSASQFKLKLTGHLTDSLDGHDISIDLGTSPPIPVISTADQLGALIVPINRLITADNVMVALGNPCYVNNMNDYVYGDVVAGMNPGDPAATYIGAWFIYIQCPAFYQYDYLDMQVINDNEAVIIGNQSIQIRKTQDILAPDITVVTDCDYLPETFPWQVGTIASCIDYKDTGYGIIRATSRTFSVE